MVGKYVLYPCPFVYCDMLYLSRLVAQTAATLDMHAQLHSALCLPMAGVDVISQQPTNGTYLQAPKPLFPFPITSASGHVLLPFQPSTITLRLVSPSTPSTVVTTIILGRVAALPTCTLEEQLQSIFFDLAILDKSHVQPHPYRVFEPPSSILHLTSCFMISSTLA